MLLTILYILLNSVFCPSILFVGTIFLVSPATYPHPFLQAWPHLVSLLGVVARWSGEVIIMGSSIIPEVVIGFVVPLFFLVADFLVFIWYWSLWNWLDRANIFSCYWVRLCDSIKLILVRFSISSLSSIVAFVMSCSASSVIVWVSV